MQIYMLILLNAPVQLNYAPVNIINLTLTHLTGSGCNSLHLLIARMLRRRASLSSLQVNCTDQQVDMSVTEGQ